MIILVSINLFFFIKKRATPYIIKRTDQYGIKANEERQKRGIPIIGKYLLPTHGKGERWIVDKKPSVKNKLVHGWKNIVTTKSEGWKEEYDGFYYYLNDTTNYHLVIQSDIFKDSTHFSGRFGKSKNESDIFIDFKYREISSSEIDSLKLEWGID